MQALLVGSQMSALKSMVGQKVERLEVIRRAGSSKRGQALWLCKCDCGNTVIIHGSTLRNGRSRSCGCLRVDTNKKNAILVTKHGDASGGKLTPEYRSWASMKQRCFDPNHKHFDKYGGRGIKIAAAWLDYSNFLRDMGRRPTLEHTLDRYPDKDGNYELGNCRWATRSEQNGNRRKWKWKKNK